MGSLACVYDPESSQAKEFMDKNKLPELSLEEILLNKDIKECDYSISRSRHIKRSLFKLLKIIKMF